MKVLFVRHGESEANVQRIFSNRGLKHPLTHKGQAEAQTLAERLHEANLEIRHIYSSPVLRAQQTAATLAARLGVAISVHEELREFDVGRWEDTDYDAGGFEEYRSVTRRWIQQNDWEARITGGESLTEIVGRLKRFLDSLTHGHTPSETVLCLGHGGLFRVALPHIFHNAPYSFCECNPIGTTNVIHAELIEGSWLCHDWCGMKPSEPLP